MVEEGCIRRKVNAQNNGRQIGRIYGKLERIGKGDGD